MTERDVQELKVKLRSEDKSIQHLEFLFRDYEPRAYLFIVFECVRRLEGEGFDVWWEGKGAWERDLAEWPWHVDALVFAAR